MYRNGTLGAGYEVTEQMEEMIWTQEAEILLHPGNTESRNPWRGQEESFNWEEEILQELWRKKENWQETLMRIWAILQTFL